MGRLSRDSVDNDDGTLFIAPPAGGTLSGGFLINTLIADRLTSVRASISDLGPILAAYTAGATVLFDSLYLFEASSCEALVRESPRLRLVLLAHSLPSLLPDRPISVRREDRARECILLPLLAGAIAPSAFMQATLARRGLRRAAVIAQPPPICDGRVAAPDATPAPAHEAAAVHVLTVAGITPAKGILDAAEALCACGSLRWEWTIAGAETNASYAAAIRGVIEDAGATERVKWAGVVAPGELHRYYCDADVLLLPSRMESYGLAFAEAISHGVPVVGYRCAAVPEVVGTAGRLVDAGDVAALAAAVREPEPLRACVAARRTRLPHAQAFVQSVMEAV